jgi:hypothetical protein
VICHVILLAAAGGVFSMAYDGSALSSLAKIKEQIMLNGGVLTSMIIGPTATFRLYDGRANGGVFDDTTVLSDARAAEPHALFCYG